MDQCLTAWFIGCLAEAAGQTKCFAVEAIKHVSLDWQAYIYNTEHTGSTFERSIIPGKVVDLLEVLKAA